MNNWLIHFTVDTLSMTIYAYRVVASPSWGLIDVPKMTASSELKQQHVLTSLLTNPRFSLMKFQHNWHTVKSMRINDSLFLHGNKTTTDFYHAESFNGFYSFVNAHHTQLKNLPFSNFVIIHSPTTYCSTWNWEQERHVTEEGWENRMVLL